MVLADYRQSVDFLLVNKLFVDKTLTGRGDIAELMEDNEQWGFTAARTLWNLNAHSSGSFGGNGSTGTQTVFVNPGIFNPETQCQLCQLYQML